MFCKEEIKKEEEFLKEVDIPSNYSSLDYGLSYLLKTDLSDKLKEIKVKVYLLHGEKDEISPLNAGKYLAENLPNKELVIIDNCGHIPFFTQKEYCLNFLKNKEG